MIARLTAVVSRGTKESDYQNLFLIKFIIEENNFTFPYKSTIQKHHLVKPTDS
jgi:hypothetical protein